MDLAKLRERIQRILDQEPDSDAAYVHAADLLREVPLGSLPEFRLVVLRSFTIEPLKEALQVKCFLRGVRLGLFLSQFNQVPQEILTEDGPLYRFKPHVIFLAVRLEELVPRFFSDYGDLSDEEIQAVAPEVLGTLSGWVEDLGKRSTANILLSNFMVPTAGREQISLIRALNARLLELKERFPRVTLFDLDLLASRIGKERFCDPLQWYRMSNPYRLSAYPAYAEALLSHLPGIQAPRKCLVLDLDNVLWGGAVGEEGVDGVLLSGAYPGNCFKDFQRAVLQLSRRGVLLAINSKGNPAVALQMLRSHPEMVLRENDFSAIRINWSDKADNLREIAQELNIGLDAMAFLDDSPAECERIRQAYPDVLVVQMPAERHRYRSVLEGLGCFEQVAVTEEDRDRTRMYQAQGERRKLASQCGTLEEFYAGLNMRGTLSRNNRPHLPRIAQMTQKTNQFNLTTLRCTEAEIEERMGRGFVYSLQIEDRLGDNGIVAVALVSPSPDGAEWVIDNLLMSCRVVMRTIEDSLLAEIAQDAKESGAQRLVGRYVPSGRNQMVRDFYAQRGFSIPTNLPGGCVEYQFDLTGEAGVKPSPWIQLAEEMVR